MPTKKKQKSKIEFIIEVPIYRSGIKVLITKDEKEFNRCVNKTLGEDCKRGLPDALGMVIRKDGYIPVLWLPEIPKTAMEFGVMSHEIFHAVFSILHRSGILLTYESEESYSHVIGYVTEEILNYLSDNERKQKN